MIIIQDIIPPARKIIKPVGKAIEKQSRNKYVSAVLALALVFQTVFGTFLPINLSFKSPYISSQETKAVGENWFNTGGTWNYRRAITLSPVTPAANYQVKVLLSSAALTGAQQTSGNANGNDIRFTASNGSTLQDYWIESWSATGTSVTATIWVEVATSGESTIYMYYGNNAATAGTDGINTFDFFDDFTGAGIDTGKWSGDTGSASLSGGIMTLTATATGWKSLYSINYYASPAVFASRVLIADPSSAGRNDFVALDADGSDYINFDTFADSTKHIRSNANSSGVQPTSNYTTGSYSILEMQWIKESGTKFLQNGTEVQNSPINTNIPQSNLKTGYDVYRASGTQTILADWIYVRKYNASEPAATVQNEETPNTAPTATAPIASQATDGTGYVTIQTTIDDADNDDTVKIKVEYSLDGGSTWTSGDPYLTSYITTSPDQATEPDVTNAQEYQVGMPTNNIMTSAGANTVTIKWDTKSASNGTGAIGSESNVKLRITPHDGTVAGTPVVSDAVFAIDNSAPSGGSVQINSNDSYTTSANTTLTLSATGASQMKFSNDNATYSAYEAYGASKAWDINDVAYGGSSAEGLKTVYVIFKDALGNESSAANDNITYDTTPPTNPNAAVEAQGAVTDTWQNNKNDPNFTSFTGEADDSGIANYYVYFGTDSAGVTTDSIATDAYNPNSFATSNTRYLRVIAKDNAGLWADPDGGGATCTNTNASRPADADCWATIFIHKYDIDAPNTPSPASLPVSWTNTNSFNFSWSDPGDVGGSGVVDYTYQTDAGTGATDTASTSVNGLTSNAVGTKLFSVKANDNAGNSGTDGTVNFYYDNSAPTNAGAVTDGNGSLDDTWGIVSDPSFTWVAGSDAGDQSGVKEYDVYWGTDSGGTTVTATVGTNAYNPAAIPVNTPYYLRIRTRDNALNASAWATKFTMKYSQAASTPTNAVQTANGLPLAFGDWTSDTTPTVGFTLADPDGDTVGYVGKIDNNGDFSSNEVFYTYGANDLPSGGNYTFTVGQAAGTGTYTNGNEGQTLAEGQYYWKGKAVESHGLSSAEATANGGLVAFGVDTTNPTGTTLGFGTITTDSITATVSGAADAVSGLNTAPYYFENTTAVTNSGWQAGTSWSSNTLSPNTQYNFKVTSRDKAGNTQATVTENKYTLASQVTGAGVANATDKSSYKINLSWTDQGQSGMKIEQDTSCNGYETTLYDNTSVNAASPYQVSVSANTCYQFRISSYNGDGALNSTTPAETSQITSPPGQPSGLTHTANTSVSITWDWNDVTGATGYKVYRASDNSLLTTIGTATSTWDQGTLSANTQYSVYVRATNANGEGIASSNASAYTSANTPTTAAHSANTVSSINWTWASGGAQKDYYAWTDTPVDNSDWTASAYWDQSTLSANTQYTFSVKARNEDLDETNSASSSAYTSQNTPSGISFGVITASSIDVSDSGTFPNLAQGSSGLYFLNVTNSDTPDWIQTNSWTNSSLNPNTQYSYKVKVRNGDGDETSYTAESAKYTLANIPSTPTVNNAGVTTLDVNVNVNSNPAGTEFAIYKETGATCDGSGGSYIAADGSDNGATAVWQTDAVWSTSTATGLAATTQYSFCVKARNGDNTETSFGSAASGTTNAANVAPNAPALVSPANASFTSDTTPTLSANYSDPDSGDTGTTNYRIATSAGNCLSGTVVDSGTSSATSDENEDTAWTPASSIGSDGTYYWCAQNNDSALTSSWTSMGNFILDTAAPAGTTLGFGTVDIDSITATVSGAADSGAGLHATPYYFENTTAATNSGWQAGSSWASGSLTPNTQYTFKVKSKDTLGNESSFTATESKYTLANVPSSLGLAADSGIQITASWNANSNSDGTEYYAENTTAGTNSGWTTSTSWISSGLSCGTSYSFKVKSKNGDDTETVFTSVVSSSTNACPTPTPTQSATPTSTPIPVSNGGGSALWPGAYSPPNPPPAGFSVIINNNDQYTYDREVILGLNGGSDVKRMAISNYSDFRGASQEAYRSTIIWILPEGEGMKTVYVKFYTEWGQSSSVVSDEIIYRMNIPSPTVVPATGQPGQIVAPINSTPLPTIKPKGKATALPVPNLTPAASSSSVPIVTPEIEPTASPVPAASSQPEEVEEQIPQEAPLSLKGTWDLLPGRSVGNFIFTPLPIEIEDLTRKFPSLEKTFEKVGVTRMSDMEKLKSVELNLPSLSEAMELYSSKIGSNNFSYLPTVSIVELPVEQKVKMPQEVVFAKISGGKIDLNANLFLDSKGKPQERINIISGKSLTLFIKPGKPVKSIKGYIVFKSNNNGQNKDFTYIESSLSSLSQGLALVKPALADNSGKDIEQRLILEKFEYEDPDGDGIYNADIKSPAIEGEYEIVTTVDYKDSSLGEKEFRLITVVDPEGYVYRKIDGEEARILNARVSLFWLNPQSGQYELWPAKDFSQQNPQITDVTGKYSFLVPEGTYYISAESDKYKHYQSDPFEVKEGSGIHKNIELEPERSFLDSIDWKILVIIITLLLLAYNFYRDRQRDSMMANNNQ